ncbi:MAG: membrane protein insertase YidC [Phycisphaerales bacterium]
MNAPFLTIARSTLQTAVLACLGTLALTLCLVHSLPDAGGDGPARISPVGWIQDAQEEAEDGSTGAADAAGVAEEPEQSESATDVVDSGYTARRFPPVEGGWAPLGDLDDRMQKTYLSFTPLGAGIESIRLPDEFETVKFEKQVTLQEEIISDSGVAAVPFAVISVVINDTTVMLSGSQSNPVWDQVAPGVFEAFIDDAEGNTVLRIERRFTLKPGTAHGFILDETIENRSDTALRVRLNTTGMMDMPQAESTYAGDRRRVRYGFLLPPERQGTSLGITVDKELHSRTKLLGKRTDTRYGKAYEGVLQVWPNEEILPGAHRLSWLGMTDRYFAVILHPVFDPTSVSDANDKLLSGYARIDRLLLNPLAGAADTVQLLRLVGEQHELDPGESYTNTLGVYAGLRNRPIMTGEPIVAALNMPEMVVSNLGGICAPCTFSWLTDILISVLRTFHMVVGDWAMAIILLVFVVRSVLHPVTRWSQIRVQRFSVQMQSMAPKQKAIREKYKDDSKRQQQEMAKLWKEEGISPAGMLGCLPMFLQSPVWIALYATLFFATELRHAPAFYGVFQDVFSWGFMSDLAAPDGAVPLPAFMHFSFPLWGTVDSLNVLPLLLGVVFYMHQKYLTPPTQATLTPEQESQQKLMKVMMVVMFPVMMYAAPSGLALYFITNSTVGIIENKWIRAHMKKHGMLEIENIKAERSKKGPGFMARMMEAAEAQKQLKEKGPAQPNPASKHSRRIK